MVGMIDGFRWCILGESSPIYWPSFFVGILIIFLLLWIGVKKFRRRKKNLLI